MLGGGDKAVALATLLLDPGAAVDIQCKDGETALMLAVQHGGKDAMVLSRMLRASGTTVSIRNQSGETAAGLADPGSEVHSLLLDPDGLWHGLAQSERQRLGALVEMRQALRLPVRLPT